MCKEDLNYYVVKAVDYLFPACNASNVWILLLFLPQIQHWRCSVDSIMASFYLFIKRPFHSAIASYMSMIYASTPKKHLILSIPVFSPS